MKPKARNARVGSAQKRHAGGRTQELLKFLEYLETYCKIYEAHPEQTLILVSIFQRSGRSEVVQTLKGPGPNPPGEWVLRAFNALGASAAGLARAQNAAD